MITLEKRFVLVEPTHPLVEFYNELWKNKYADKTVQLFKNEQKINISEFLPDKTEEYENSDNAIREYLNNDNIECFLKEINKVYHTRVNLQKFTWNDGYWCSENIKKEGVEGFIEKCKNITGRNEYSFATKVFNFIDEREYPILDSVSVTLLNEYYNMCFNKPDRKEKWGVYADYKSDYKELLKQFKLDDVSFKEFDIFLWTYGVVIGNYWKKCGVLKYESVRYTG